MKLKKEEEYVEEDDTEIKMEPVSVKTEPFIKTESIKTEPDDDTKIKLESVTIPLPFKDESSKKHEKEEKEQRKREEEMLKRKKQEEEKAEKEETQKKRLAVEKARSDAKVTSGDGEGEPQIILGLGGLQLEKEQLDWVFTLFKKRILEDQERAKKESRPPSTEFIIHFADLSLEEKKRQSQKEAEEKERERIAQENRLIQDKYIQNFKQQRLKNEKNSQMICQNIQQIENHLTSIETLSDTKNISIPKPQRRMLIDLRGDLGATKRASTFFETKLIDFSFDSLWAVFGQQVFTWIFETQKKERMQQFKNYLIKTNQQECVTDMEVSMRNIYSCFGESYKFPTKN